MPGFKKCDVFPYRRADGGVTNDRLPVPLAWRARFALLASGCLVGLAGVAGVAVRAQEPPRAAQVLRGPSATGETRLAIQDVEQQSLRLAIAARAVADEDPAQALLLAAEAVDRCHAAKVPVLPEAENTLRELLQRTGGIPVRGHSGPVRHLALSLDGRTLASASDDGTIRLWDLTQAPQVVPGAVLRSSNIERLAVANQGQVIAAVQRGGALLVWQRGADGAYGMPRSLRESVAVKDSVGFSCEISSTGDWLWAGGPFDHVLWNLKAADIAGSARAFPEHAGFTVGCFSRDGQQLYTTGKDGLVRQWNVSRDGISAAATLDLWEQSAEKSPDGVPFWTPKGLTWRTLPEGKKETFPAQLTLTGDGDHLALHGELIGWLRLDQGQLPQTPQLFFGGGYTSFGGLLCGSGAVLQLTNGRLLVYRGNGELVATELSDLPPEDRSDPAKVRSHVEQGSVTVTASGKGGVSALFTPDGSILAACTDQSSVVTVWRTSEMCANRTPQWTLRGHARPIATGPFCTPDGRWLITGSEDHTIRLWPVDHLLDDTAQVIRGNDEFGQLHHYVDDDWLITAVGKRSEVRWLRSGDARPALAAADHEGRVLSLTSASVDPRLPAERVRVLIELPGESNPRWQLGEWDLRNPQAPQYRTRWQIDAPPDQRHPDPLVFPDHILLRYSWYRARLSGDESRVTFEKVADMPGEWRALHYSGAGRWLSVSLPDGRARLWDLLGDAPAPPKLELAGPQSILVTRNGRWAYQVYDGLVWDLSVTPPRERRDFALGGGRLQYTSKSGRYVPIVSSSKLQVWDTEQGDGDPRTATLTLNTPDISNTSLGFSSDERWLLTTHSVEGQGDEVSLWNLPELRSDSRPAYVLRNVRPQYTQELRGEQRDFYVHDVFPTATNQVRYSIQTVLPSGKLAERPLGNEAPLTISRDRRWLVTLRAHDWEIVVRPLAPELLVEAARRRAGRTLASFELAPFGGDTRGAAPAAR